MSKVDYMSRYVQSAHTSLYNQTKVTNVTILSIPTASHLTWDFIGPQLKLRKKLFGRNVLRLNLKRFDGVRFPWAILGKYASCRVLGQKI